MWRENSSFSMIENKEGVKVSKRKAKKEEKKQQLKASKEAFVSVDGQVQHTNDDSVVSKRSSVTLGYMEDKYLRIFVKAKARRSPLINRGYYLRMTVMNDIVTKSVSILCKAHDSIQVVSLGAGYDTFSFRCLLSSEQKEEYAKQVQFYDVDFPAVMMSKATLMLSGRQSGIVFPSEWQIDPNNEKIFVRSPSYCAVGVDLRSAEQDLLSALMAANDSFSPLKPTVFYSECVLQYMAAEESSALIRFLAASFPNALFFSYDQINPKKDSFGHLMVSSLKTRNCPLLGIDTFYNGKKMIERMLECGMTKSSFSNFFDLSRYYLNALDEERVSQLEPFDEVEEWSEMCDHYGITMGQTLASFPSNWHPCFSKSFSISSERPTDCGSPLVASTEIRADLSPLPAVSCISQSWPSGRLRFERWGFGDVAALTLSNGDLVFVSFGGFHAGKNHGRSNSIFCYSFYRGELTVVVEREEDVPLPLIFHSFTKISSSQFIVFGGRTNPLDVSSKAFLLTLSGIDSGEQVISANWEELVTEENAPSPLPRFRHTAVLCKEKNVLFVFGGKDERGQFLSDSWIGTVDTDKKIIRWHLLTLSRDVPPPSCSSVAVLFEDRIILSGGLTGYFQAKGFITSIDLTSGWCIRGPDSIGDRFSHSMTLVKVSGVEYLFVLHGSSTSPKNKLQEAMLLNPHTLQIVRTVSVSDLPFWWSRHSCIHVSDNVLLVIGGGYTCFSFGTAASRPQLLLLDGGKFSAPCISSFSLNATQTVDTPVSTSVLFSMKSVVTMELNKETFESISNSARIPVLFEQVDFGVCLTKWKDYQYLIESEKNVVVSVHVARGTTALDFIRKNFTYRHMSFEQLIHHVRDSTHGFRDSQKLPDEIFYFRSISSHMKTERSNIWKDFPNIGKDFCLPCGIDECILPRLHQACWRINATPLSLWMHYDTLDNVLCQITGRKKVTLFPPSQYNNLYMVNSSSGVLSVTSPDLRQFPKFIEATKHGFQVVLNAGDMIFIPALWFHHIETIESEDDYSISVNIFYEHHHFPMDLYDKKDLYGNKDLPTFSALRCNLMEVAAAQVAKLEKEPSNNVHSNAKYTAFAIREAIQDLEALAVTLEAKS